MPDITMCPGTECPINENCYRFRARPSGMMQSWFTNVPWNKETKSCDHYWPFVSKSEMKRLDIMKVDKDIHEEK